MERESKKMKYYFQIKNALKCFNLCFNQRYWSFSEFIGSMNEVCNCNFIEGGKILENRLKIGMKRNFYQVFYL